MMTEVLPRKFNSPDTSKTLLAVNDELLKEVQSTYRELNKIPDELLSALNFVYGAPLLPALDLVDHRNVSCLTSPSGRCVYQVIGSSGTPYTCLSTSFYCSCPAYRYSVLLKDDHIMCKHVLAIKLSEAMDVTKKVEVSNEEMVDTIKSMD